MSVRIRTWTDAEGQRKQAWIVDYADRNGHRHIRTFQRKRDADEHQVRVRAEAAEPTEPTKKSNSKPWSRSRRNRLAALIEERGLLTEGFHESLRQLIREFYPEEGDDPEALAEQLSDLFGGSTVVPAAHRIVRDGDAGVTVEVYEVENSIEISERKLAIYGCAADHDELTFDLHILDRYDHEIIVPHENLMRFAFIDLYDEPTKKLMLKEMRSRAPAQHHGIVVVDDEKTSQLRREIFSLRRVAAKADYSEFKQTIENVIYQLGCKTSHRQIAERENISPAVVRGVARLLKSQSVDPHTIVKDSHARWKAAYDAVLELGIQP